MKKQELLEMDPLDLLDYLVEKTKINIPTELTPENQSNAVQELSRAMQFEISLSEMADRVNLLKQKMKMVGDKEGVAVMQMRENVLKGQASRSKRSYDAISRMFTIKNQELQELKMLGLTS